jgi:hypothetical protein
MSKYQVKHEFTVVVDGETYRCDRTVYGKRVLTQRVHVAGMGTEPDVGMGRRGCRAGETGGITAWKPGSESAGTERKDGGQYGLIGCRG